MPSSERLSLAEYGKRCRDSLPDMTHIYRESKWEISIKFFSPGLRKPHRREGRKSTRASGDKGFQETKALSVN